MSDTRDRDSAGGFTLIELLVYMMLIGLVLAIVGAMMINTMRTSNTVTSVTDASNAGQSRRPFGGEGHPQFLRLSPHLARRKRSVPGRPHGAWRGPDYLGVRSLVLLG